jgi:hypothetical protein
MADFVPSGRQLVLLAKISGHIAVTLNHLATGDLETDFAASIDLIELAKEGLIFQSRSEQIVRCTPLGRLWVAGHQNWRAGETRRAGGGH